jgi:hypothetical protein
MNLDVLLTLVGIYAAWDTFTDAYKNPTFKQWMHFFVFIGMIVHLGAMAIPAFIVYLFAIYQITDFFVRLRNTLASE